MAVVIAAKLYCRHISDFPTLQEGRAAILVTLDEPDDEGAEVFSVTTNIGAGMTADQISKLAGALLHQLSHTMTAGLPVDITDLNEPIPTDFAGGV